MKYTAPNIFHGLDFWCAKLTAQTLTPWLIHGGSARQEREKARVLPWNGLGELVDGFYKSKSKALNRNQPDFIETYAVEAGIPASCPVVGRTDP
jgi:hypothetical protein